MLDKNGSARAKNLLEHNLDLAIAVKAKASEVAFHFNDYDSRSGLAVEVRKGGLNRHYARLIFGNYSRDLKAHIAAAEGDRLKTAKALLQSISLDVNVSYVAEEQFESRQLNQLLDQIEFVRIGLKKSGDEEEVLKTVELIVSPLLAAMAELIGYSEADHEDGAVEGSELELLIRKRERSRRNRLLALKIHGSCCLVCGFSSKEVYGGSIDVIEIHHLEPVASLNAPRAYDPATDLVPLCPNCHRAAHSRPLSPPLELEELRRLYFSGTHD